MSTIKKRFQPTGLREMAPGIYCACCLKSIRKQLLTVNGISTVQIHHDGPAITIHFDAEGGSLKLMNKELRRIDTCSSEAGPYKLTGVQTE